MEISVVDDQRYGQAAPAAIRVSPLRTSTEMARAVGRDGLDLAEDLSEGCFQMVATARSRLMKSQHTTPDLRPAGLMLSGAGALSAYAIWLDGAAGDLNLGAICGMSGASLGHCAVCYVSALGIAAGLALMALGAPRRRAVAR
jgi:hypothetical protein